ncbi:MAG: ATP-binding protein, partial [Candidatus Dadabacteria bacterium]
GVGLAIVRRIAEAEGGRVFARSEPGRGTRFYLELPETPA